MNTIDPADLNLSPVVVAVYRPRYFAGCGLKFRTPDPLALDGLLAPAEERHFDEVTYTLAVFGEHFTAVCAELDGEGGRVVDTWTHERYAADLRAELTILEPEVVARWERQQAALDDLDASGQPGLLRGLVGRSARGGERSSLHLVAGDIRSLREAGHLLAAALLAACVGDEPEVAMAMAVAR
jgi:hypothetical protein